MPTESILRAPRPVLLALLLAACGPANHTEESPAPSGSPLPPEDEAPPFVSSYRVVETEDAGTLRGRIHLGKERPLEPVSVDKDADVCGTEEADPPLGAGSGDPLPNTVVWLEDITRGKAMPPADETVLIEISGCAVLPRVRLAPVGARLVLLNRDDLFHDIRATTEGGQSAFRDPLPMQDFRAEEELSRPGVLRLRCEAGHPWMAAYVVAHAHPYYELTDDDGNFTMKEVPAGEYRLMAWHELTSRAEKAVTVEPRGTLEIELSLDVAEASGKPEGTPQ